MRFSLAHEVGHLVLHKQLIPIIRPKTIEEWKNLRLTLPEEAYNWLELHAYEFARRILVPRNVLVEELKQRETNIKAAYRELPDVDDEVVIREVSIPISKRFDVNPLVIYHRIKNEKLWEKYKD